MESETKGGEAGWPLRTWVLTLAGALIALTIQQLSDLPDQGWDWGRRLVGAAILFLGVGGIAFALVWQRGRHVPALLLALLCGIVSGGVLIWNGMPNDGWFFGSWQLFSGLVAAGFFITLFQAAQGRHPHLPTRWSLDGLKDWKRDALLYADVHEAIWTDALLLFAASLFTLVVWLVANLLGEMFALVKIEILRDLVRKEWCIALLFGAGMGGAIGLLRERTPIIAALQRVAMIVLRVLPPILAVGLVAFIAVLPFTGLEPLWATGSTSPMMLSAAVGALFLVNAVIGDRRDDAPVAPALRWGAIALGLALLPLVLIAAWSTGLRIDQRGLSPDRLWALTFIVLGCVTAIAYVVAIARRGDWIGALHRSNLHLAFLLGGVSLIFSTPILGFERISAADQVGRLESGRTKPVDFDYRALWFDFGPPGREAIRKIAREAKDPQARQFAANAAKMKFRYDDAPNEVAQRSGDALDARLTIIPQKVPLDQKLRERLTDYNACGASGPCLLRYVAGAPYAVVMSLPRADCSQCNPGVPRLLLRGKGDWGEPDYGPMLAVDVDKNGARRRLDAVKAGKVELRIVQRRQLFVDGKPVGSTFDMENAVEQP